MSQEPMMAEFFFMGLMQTLSDMSWWSESDEDGSSIDEDYFIAGIRLENGDIRYYLSAEFKLLVEGRIKRLERAPKRDDHVSVIDRLKADLEKNMARYFF